eukprot:Skav226582  [mRNA]  locus=scaffold2846:106171:117999:- [translate_table: standard]
MKLARRRAPERLDMTPLQVLSQHNMRQEKERKLVASSREVSHLAMIGAPHWSHFSRGDPYAEFQRDKNLLKKTKAAPADDSDNQRSLQATLADPKEVGESAKEAQATRELKGTFDNAKMDGSRSYLPAYLLWNHTGPCERVPFPQVHHLAEVTGSLRRPRSEGLITVSMQPQLPDKGKNSAHHTHSSICLGLRRNSYERTLL